MKRPGSNELKSLFFFFEKATILVRRPSTLRPFLEYSITDLGFPAAAAFLYE